MKKHIAIELTNWQSEKLKEIQIATKIDFTNQIRMAILDHILKFDIDNE